MAWSKEKSHRIYMLTSPEGEARYLGITCGPLERRLSQHIGNFQKGHKSFWIKKLVSQGETPGIELLCDDISFESAIGIEPFLIESCRQFGIKLTNQSSGGELGMFGRTLSEDHKRRISECNSNRVWSPTSRKKVSQSLTGRKQSPERAAQSRTNWVGRKHTPETKEKMSKVASHREEAKRCFSMLAELWS